MQIALRVKLKNKNRHPHHPGSPCVHLCLLDAIECLDIAIASRIVLAVIAAGAPDMYDTF